jgi:peroxiredoxin
MLKPGDIAPEFFLKDINQKSISLPKILNAGDLVLLVFLRHLG